MTHGRQDLSFDIVMEELSCQLPAGTSARHTGAKGLNKSPSSALAKRQMWHQLAHIRAEADANEGLSVTSSMLTAVPTLPYYEIQNGTMKLFLRHILHVSHDAAMVYDARCPVDSARMLSVEHHSYSCKHASVWCIRRHDRVTDILHNITKHLCDVVVNLDRDQAQDADVPGPSPGSDDDSSDANSGDDDTTQTTASRCRRTRPDLQFVTENADGSTTATPIVTSFDNGHSALDVEVTSLRWKEVAVVSAPTSANKCRTWEGARLDKIRKHGERWNCFPYIVSTSGALDSATAAWTKLAIIAAGKKGYKRSYASVHRDIVSTVWKHNFYCYANIYEMCARKQHPAPSLLLKP